MAAAATALVQTASADEIFIRFPPFPPAPPGVTITPFKDFRETGIKLFCPNENGVEVDGAGIPTVTLEHRHVSDQCKTDALRKKEDLEPTVSKKRKGKGGATATAPMPKWWEIWRDEEAGKFTGPYNLKSPAIDRLCRASTDFRLSRTWPKPEPRQPSAEKLWEQFSVFIGLQAIIPAWIRAQRIKEEKAANAIRDAVEKSGENVNPPEDESDDGSDDFPLENDAPILLQQDGIEGPPDEIDQDKMAEKETAAIEEENVRKDDRMLAFLVDPETVVKMFLSSYMRKEGLIWSDSNLHTGPRVLFFFLRYVLRNKLLPEYDAGLKKALIIVERAQMELPSTSDIAKIIPCEVGLALRDKYGSKEEKFKYQPMEDPVENGKENKESVNGVEMDYATLEQPGVEYVGNGEFIDVIQPVGTGITEGEKIDEDGENGEKLRKRTKLGDDPQEENRMKVDDGPDSGEGWGNYGSLGGPWDDQAVKWIVPVYSISNFLGMDGLPSTHATGVVEESVRKIISVHAPNGKSTSGTLEEILESKLGRIVLAPWNEWDVPVEGESLDEIRRVYTEIYRGKRFEKAIRRLKLKEEENVTEESQKTEEKRKPKPEEYYDEDAQDNLEPSEAKIIWENSRGWVVDPSSGDSVFSDCTPEKPETMAFSGVQMPHNPHEDVIEVIVDPAVIQKIVDLVGMGIGGTFVQLVNEEELKAGGATKTFWYMEGLKLVIPSFYAS
ncbi:hypothetical protein AX15_007411 [Amanita polypyramis BW_CC]|nr:hypothetical protein AX15_007411 [Amanita polypyramis BW_CC]